MLSGVAVAASASGLGVVVGPQDGLDGVAAGTLERALAGLVLQEGDQGPETVERVIDGGSQPSVVVPESVDDLSR